MRVALLDPGSEGLMLAAMLRGAGFHVELAALEDIARLAVDALVLAGDAPGALTALRALRDDGERPDLPVVLVGAPQGMSIDSPGPAFGADWALSRSGVDAELLDAVRAVASRSSPKSDRPGLRERTLELERAELERSGDERSRVSARGDEASDPPSGEIEVGERKARTSDPVPVVLDPGDASSVEIAFDAEVSPALAALLVAADRRVFPHLPPIEPSLPRGEASARELVPESLLLGPSAEPDEEPALDALTFVGAVPEAQPIPLPRTTSGLPVAPEPRVAPELASTKTPAPRSRASVPADALTPPPRRRSMVPSTAEPRATPPEGRAPTDPKPASVPQSLPPTRGEGDGMAWIAALREQLVSGLVRLQLSSPELTVELSVRDGHVLTMDAPLSRAVLVSLDGADAATCTEDDAERELRRRIDAGLLSRYREAQRRGEARRALLGGLIAAPQVTYELGPVRDRLGERPGSSSPLFGARLFGERLGPLLVELAGAALGRERVLSMLGGPSAVVSPTGAYLLLARECELRPEVDALLATSPAPSLGELLDAGWEEPALPGTVAVMAALGALEVRLPEREVAVAPSQALAVASWLEVLAARAEDADYFALLELTSAASGAEVRRAHERLSARLSGLELSRLELAHLEPQRRAALASVEEAHRVLRVERWRESYRASLR